MINEFQLDMEKASLESEWTEVRSMLVEKERELALMNSRQEQTPSPTVNADELSHRVQQLEGSVTQMNAIIKQQNEKIEADKVFELFRCFDYLLGITDAN